MCLPWFLHGDPEYFISIVYFVCCCYVNMTVMAPGNVRWLLLSDTVRVMYAMQSHTNVILLETRIYRTPIHFVFKRNVLVRQFDYFIFSKFMRAVDGMICAWLRIGPFNGDAAAADAFDVVCHTNKSEIFTMSLWCGIHCKPKQIADSLFRFECYQLTKNNIESGYVCFFAETD